MITLSRVGLDYHSSAETVTALDEVDLQVNSGEFVALRGASGSGKTTLLNVMAGLVLPDRGDVVVARHALADLNEADRAKVRLADVGVVFQDSNLIAEFSALENIALPLRARGWSRSDATVAATQLLESVGLPGLGRRHPSELSGGQKQRVGIARGLAGGRQVLLADEPTGALDSVTSEAVFELLRSIADGGVTIVVATHDPLVERFATRIVTIRDGFVVGDSLTPVATL